MVRFVLLLTATLGVGCAMALQAGWPAGALGLVAGAATCAAGADLALRRAQPAAGVLFASSGLALQFGGVPLPAAGSAALFTAALAFGAFAPALAGAAAVCTPAAGRLGALAITVTLTVIAVFGVAATATFDPLATGCFDCPRNLLSVAEAPWVREAAPSAAAVLCALLGALAATRWLNQPALLRRATAPAVLGGTLTAACGVAGTWEAQCLVLMLASGTIGLQAYRAYALRGRIAELVLSTLPSPEALRDALARTLGDPELMIAYPGSPSPRGAVTEVTRGTEVVALIGHSPSLAPERLATAARGAGPALRHASARARQRAQLAELRASRARVIDVSDDARRRVERDLHDGTQQRLIALAFALAQHASAARAEAELQRALDDLRRLAHGIHPASLTDGGLAAALDELKERSRVPLRVTAVPSGRSPAAIEAALYRLVLDAVSCAERHGDGGAVVIAIAPTHAAVTLPGVPRAAAALVLEHAADRIAALDGTLTIADERVEACLPCAS